MGSLQPSADTRGACSYLDIPPAADVTRDTPHLMLGGEDFGQWRAQIGFHDTLDTHPQFGEVDDALRAYQGRLGLDPQPLDGQTKMGYAHTIETVRRRLAEAAEKQAAQILLRLPKNAQDDELAQRATGQGTPEAAWAAIEEELLPFPDKFPGHYSLDADIRYDGDGNLVLLLSAGLVGVGRPPTPIILSDETRQAFLDELGPLYRPMLERALYIRYGDFESPGADPGFLPGLEEKPSSASCALQELLARGPGADPQEIVPLVRASDTEGRMIHSSSMYGSGIGQRVH